MPAQGGLLKFLDAYVAFHGDMSGLDADIATSEQKAKAAGDRVEKSFSPRRVIGALATAAAAGFAVMTKGSILLNETLTNVQARSGAVGAQWDAMSNTIQRQNRRTTLSLDEIGQGVEAIKTDLGATADEIEMAGDRLTDFGLVAGESFAGAVRGADDLKDAYETTLLEALGILDALVVSHQAYGGSLIANRDALVAMAPAIRAANLGWQDGLALINLFNAAGVDASAIPAALQRALASVKSPAELQRLIADIQATEDPFLRAEKAAELFGARAGAKMASALAPGRGALADYVVDVEDAAGATETAARKIDSSWTRFVQLLVQNLEGAAASVGNAIGPILEIIASVGTSVGAIALLNPGLGSKLAGGLKAMFLKVTPAAVAGAATTGAAAGAAFSVAFAAAAVVAVAAVYMQVRADAEAQGAALVTQVGDFAKVASLEQLRGAREGVAQDLARSKRDVIGDWLGLTGSDQIQKVLDELDREIARKSEEIGKNAGTAATSSLTDAAASQLATARAKLEAATITAFGGVPVGIAGLTGSTRQAIIDLINASVNEIEAQRSGIDAGIDKLNALLKEGPTTLTEELENLLKSRSSQTLADALESPDLLIRQYARKVAADLDNAIAELEPRPGIMSSVSKQIIADLKTSTEPELRGFAGWFQQEFNKVTAAESPAALAAGQAFAQGENEGRPYMLLRRQYEQAMRDAIKGANIQIGSDATAAAIHELLKDALESSDPLIRADAEAEALRWAKAITDAIADPGPKADATASARELAMAVVDYLKSGEAKDLVSGAWRALTSGLTLQVPSGVPVPAPAPTPPPGYPSYDLGTPYVERDQLAFIHKREAVLSANQADDWRAGRSGGGRSVEVNIENVEIADAHDEFSLTQSLQFLAGIG